MNQGKTSLSPSIRAKAHNEDSEILQFGASHIQFGASHIVTYRCRATLSKWNLIRVFDIDIIY
jgi:hypothetical protein